MDGGVCFSLVGRENGQAAKQQDDRGGAEKSGVITRQRPVQMLGFDEDQQGAPGNCCVPLPTEKAGEQ